MGGYPGKYKLTLHQTLLLGGTEVGLCVQDQVLIDYR